MSIVFDITPELLSGALRTGRVAQRERKRKKETEESHFFFFTDPVKYFLQLFTSVAPEVKYSLTFSLHPVIRHHLNEAGAFNTGK